MIRRILFSNITSLNGSVFLLLRLLFPCVCLSVWHSVCLFRLSGALVPRPSRITFRRLKDEQ